MAASQDRGTALYGAEALAVLLFNNGPLTTQTDLQTGTGRRYQDFKFTTLLNAFFNVQANTFNTFAAVGAGTSQDSGGTDEGFLRPKWLDTGVVTTQVIEQVRTSGEQGRTKSSRTSKSIKDKYRRDPSRKDMAMFGAGKVSSLLVKHLHDGRERVRNMFFQDLGYLLVDWTPIISKPTQTALTLQWAGQSTLNPTGAQESPGHEGDRSGRNAVHLRIDDIGAIPETFVCRYGHDHQEADTLNVQLLHRLYTERQEMVLVAQHDVFVVTKDNSKSKQRKHSGGQSKPIRKLINLLEVAANFCREYAALPDIETYLRSSTMSLRSIYVIANTFRHMVGRFLGAVDYEGKTIPEPKNIACGDINLTHIIPGGRGSQGNLMNSRCIRMTQSEYEALNQPLRRRSPTQSEQSGEQEYAETGLQILPSAEQGIVLL